MKRLLLAIAALLASAAQAQTPGAPLRIAQLSETTAPCRPLAAGAPPGPRAYHRLLGERLGVTLPENGPLIATVGALIGRKVQ